MKKLILLLLIAPVLGFGQAANFYLLSLTGNTIDMSHLSSATYIVKALDKVENKELSYKVVKN